MVLKSSGSLSLSEIQGEFGGSNPISMSEYYRGNSYVPNITLNINIPTSGIIDMSDFYNSSVSSFLISPSATNVNEGDTVTFTITTTNFSGDLYWSISTGSMSNSDFTSPANAVTSGGTVFISGNTGTISFVINEDLTTEGTENFSLILKANSPTGLTVAQSSSITVNDTSQSVVPSYSLSGPASVTEGNTLTIILTTTNVPDGTVLNYTITGITSSDLSSGSLTGSFTVNSNTASVTLGIAEETLVGYLLFGGDAGKVRRFNLESTISNSSFLNETGTLLADQNFLFFKSDGLRMYFSDTTKNIRQYPLSTAYNPNSQSGPSISKSITISGTLGGACFNSTGSKFYWTDFASRYIYQHNLTTNWDISTMSGTSYTYRWQITLPTPTQISGIFMKPDGTKVFICSTNYSRVYQYTISSPFNLGPTSPSIGPAFLLTNSGPRDLTFNNSGTRMYISYSTYIDQYDLVTAWDTSTAVYNSSLNVSTYETVPNGIFVTDYPGAEGNETLRLSLDNGADFIDVTIIDVP